MAAEYRSANVTFKQAPKAKGPVVKATDMFTREERPVVKAKAARRR